MTLHGEIMNIPCEPIEGTDSEVLAFQLGHKQARHAAAVLADSSDQKLREEDDALRNDLCMACSLLDKATACAGIGPDMALDWWAEKGRLVDCYLDVSRSYSGSKSVT